MDGYLSKPIDVNDLIATLERFGQAGAGSADAVIAPAIHRAAVFDEQAALAYTGNDRQLLKEVIGLFRKDAPSSLRRIERAMRKRDSDALRMAAHALKGAIATVGSSPDARWPRKSKPSPNPASSPMPRVSTLN